MRTRTRQILFFAILGVAVCGVGWSMLVIAEAPDFGELKRKIRGKFPEVAQISTGELAAWLSDPKRAQPVLLDTRAEKEFAVSHLHGAIRVDPSAKAEAVLAQLPPGKPVVTYCSVGYRSSAMAERLQKAGVPKVANLEGSIFQWANEGPPIEASGKPAEKVHPFNAKYGKLLDEQRRANP